MKSMGHQKQPQPPQQPRRSSTRLPKLLVFHVFTVGFVLFQLWHFFSIHGRLSTANLPAPYVPSLQDYTREEEEEGDLHDDFFSACLLIMDENHRLPEWIAYHYYAMKLRHLVLLVDPRSLTSPLEIVNRWRPYFREIEVWSDESIDYHPPRKNKDPAALKDQHLTRQRHFYNKCATHLQQLNRTWVSFFDADEYISLNDSPTNSVDPLSQPNSILKYIRHSTRPRTSCILVQRTIYGATESEPEFVQRNLPSYLNGSHFETLRWQHRASHSDENNGPVKSLVHVTAKPRLTLNNRIHKVLAEKCENQLPLRIRHYLGSWESYTGRLDARVGATERGGGKKTREFFEYISQLRPQNHSDDDDDSYHVHGRDDKIRSWLAGFCQIFDYNQTLIQHLLQGAGMVPLQPKELRQINWSMTPERIVQAMKGTNGFNRWLRQQFHVQRFSNGTMTVTRNHNVSSFGLKEGDLESGGGRGVRLVRHDPRNERPAVRGKPIKVVTKTLP